MSFLDVMNGFLSPPMPRNIWDTTASFRVKAFNSQEIQEMEQPFNFLFLFILYSFFLGTMIAFNYIITDYFSTGLLPHSLHIRYDVH